MLSKDAERFNSFYVNFIPNIVMGLWSSNMFRAVAFLFEWMVLWMQDHTKTFDGNPEMNVNCLTYNCFVHLSVAHARLGYTFNRDENVRECERIEAFVEANWNLLPEVEERPVWTEKIKREREDRKKWYL